MTLKEIINLLNAQVHTNQLDVNIDIPYGCGCDLMSDVLSFIKPGSILLTGLNNPQTIRTAEIAEIKAVCLVRGKVPNREMIELAEDRKIHLLSCNYTLFEACGILYQHGLKA